MECLLPFEKIKLNVLVKKESPNSSKYGCKPSDRIAEELINYGIVNINKPKGPTSHEVSAFVQRILNIKKSGHSGTLDPRVTGVLPVALGRATKVVQYLLTAGKEYVAVMHLHKDVEEEKLKEVIIKFTGTINQLPPVKSAVKRQIRPRNIYYIEIMERDGKDVLMKIGCEAGTYIRKLLHDIGKSLGCGAHMAELIRTKAASFNDKEMWSLQDLADAFAYYKQGNEKFLRKVILPIEEAVNHLKKIWVCDSAINSICHGANLKVPGVSKLNDKIESEEDVAIFSLKDELVAVGTAKMGSNSIMKKDKGIVIKVNQVFMIPGTYPKMG
jgi:H/ACA ribonucleoprotein complex subunit 4